jgi:hypothetical protein
LAFVIVLLSSRRSKTPCYGHALLEQWVIADGRSRVGDNKDVPPGDYRRRRHEMMASRIAVASGGAIEFPLEFGCGELARLSVTCRKNAATAYECDYDGDIEPQYGVNSHDVLMMSSHGRPSLVNRVPPLRLRDRMSQE